MQAWSALKLAAETAAIEEAVTTMAEEAFRLQSLGESREQKQLDLKASDNFAPPPSLLPPLLPHPLRCFFFLPPLDTEHAVSVRSSW